MRLVLLLVPLALAAAKPLEPCPSSCRCFLSEGLKRADCKHVPEWADQQSDAQDVRIVPPAAGRGSRSSALHLTHFEVFPKVLQLAVTNRSVVELIPSGFHGLHSLQELDLSHNLLSRFNYKVFLRMPALRRLVLQGNPIALEANVPLFTSRSLLSLDLSYCDIVDVPRGSLEGMRNLSSLSLRGNPIHLEAGKPLLPVKTIVELDLSACELTAVPAGSLDGLVNLRRLYLDGNDLHVVEKGVLPRGLHLLDLSANQIRDAPTAVVSSLRNLTRLEMSDNPITCTCALIGLQGWLSRRLVVTEKPVVCAQPDKYRGLSWTKVNELELCHNEESSTTSDSESSESSESSNTASDETDESSQPLSVELPPASYEVYTHENIINHHEPAAMPRAPPIALPQVLEVKTLGLRPNNEINFIQGDQPYDHIAQDDTTTALPRESMEESAASGEDDESDAQPPIEENEGTEKDAEVFMRNADTIAMGRSMPEEGQEPKPDEVHTAATTEEAEHEHEAEHGPGHEAEPEEKHEAEHEAEQGPEHETEHEAEHEEKHEAEHEAEHEEKHEAEHEAEQGPEHEAEHEEKHEAEHESEQGPEHEAEPEEKHEAEHEREHEAEHEAEHEVKHDAEHEAEQGPEHEAEHEVKHEAEHEAEQGPEHETEHEADHEEKHEAEHIEGSAPESLTENEQAEVSTTIRPPLEVEPHEVVDRHDTPEPDTPPSTIAPAAGSVDQEEQDQKGQEEQDGQDSQDGLEEQEEQESHEDRSGLGRALGGESLGSSEEPDEKEAVAAVTAVPPTPVVEEEIHAEVSKNIVGTEEGAAEPRPEDTDTDTAPEITSVAAPEPTPESGVPIPTAFEPELKSVTMTRLENVPEIVPESVPEATPESVPVVTPEVVPESGPIATTESVAVVTPEVVSEVTPEPVAVAKVPKSMPEAAPESQPGAVDAEGPDAEVEGIGSNSILDTKHNEELAVEQVPANPEQQGNEEVQKSTITYIILGCIVVTMVVLIMYALLRSKAKKADKPVRIRRDNENPGTEMKDMMNPLLEQAPEQPEPRRGSLVSLELIQEVEEDTSSAGQEPQQDPSSSPLGGDSVPPAKGAKSANTSPEGDKEGGQKLPTANGKPNGKLASAPATPATPATPVSDSDAKHPQATQLSKVKVKAGVINTPEPRTPVLVNRANGVNGVNGGAVHGKLNSPSA